MYVFQILNLYFTKMIRKLVICLLAGFVMVPSFAQEESVTKQINKIKRDASFLYSNETDETTEKALDAARTMLMLQVQEYLESIQKTVTVNDAVRQAIYAKSNSLEMMRGSMHTVFVYVKKSEVDSICGFSPQSTPKDNEELEKEKMNNSLIDYEAKKLKETADVSIPTAQNDTSVAKTKTVTKPDLPVWQMEAIERLLDCSDVNEARAKLNRMKVEYKIKKFGTPYNCPAPDSAFWLIFSQDGSVNTVLGPGTKERISFRDMTTTELDNYKGMNAIWFNFAK